MSPENKRTQGLLQKAGAAVKERWDNLHIGQGHFSAWVREGFKEVTHQLLPAFPTGQSIIEEPGLFGNPTQGEVARDRQEQDQAKQQVAALNEEPLQTRSQIPSPSQIAEGNSSTVRGREEQDQAKQQVASLNEEPLQTRSQIPSPSQIAEGNSSTVRGRQEQDQAKQQVASLNEEPLQTRSQTPSPSQIAEGNSSASMHGDQQLASKQNVPSPSEIGDGQGQQQGQQLSQDHGRER